MFTYELILAIKGILEVGLSPVVVTDSLAVPQDIESLPQVSIYPAQETSSTKAKSSNERVETISVVLATTDMSTSSAIQQISDLKGQILDLINKADFIPVKNRNMMSFMYKGYKLSIDDERYEDAVANCVLYFDSTRVVKLHE